MLLPRSSPSPWPCSPGVWPSPHPRRRLRRPIPCGGRRPWCTRNVPVTWIWHRTEAGWSGSCAGRTRRSTGWWEISASARWERTRSPWSSRWVTTPTPPPTGRPTTAAHRTWCSRPWSRGPPVNSRCPVPSCPRSSPSPRKAWRWPSSPRPRTWRTWLPAASGWPSGGTAWRASSRCPRGPTRRSPSCGPSPAARSWASPGTCTGGWPGPPSPPAASPSTPWPGRWRGSPRLPSQATAAPWWPSEAHRTPRPSSGARRRRIPGGRQAGSWSLCTTLS